MSVRITWSAEDNGYVAVDNTRPGCSAVGATEVEAVQELADARKAWDEAKAKSVSNRKLIQKFFELPLSKRRELLGDYYDRADQGLPEMEKSLQAFSALKADGKVDDFLRKVATVPEQV